MGAPSLLFGIALTGDRLGPVYDLSPDGERFLFLKPADAGRDPSAAQLLSVEHWEHDARRRLTAARLASP